MYLLRIIRPSRFFYSCLRLVHHRILKPEFVQMFSRRRSSNQDEGVFIHYVVIPVLRVLAWPLVAFVRHEIKKREAEREGDRRMDPIPRSIHSRRRRRALTLPLPPEAKRRRTSSQSKSLLLSSLPFELRQIIWKESIGSMVLYVIIRNRKLILSGIAPWDPHRPGPGLEDRHLLSILLTCRQAYSEAIDLLYSSNQFVVIHADIIEFMPRVLLPQRINAIRSLRFHWGICGGPPFPITDGSSNGGSDLKSTTWTTIWKNLAGMEGLHELYVWLNVDDIRWATWDIKPTVDTRLLVEPIMAVTAPRYFELNLPFTCRLGKELWEQLPCQINWIEPRRQRAY